MSDVFDRAREGDDRVRRCLAAIGYPAEEIPAVLASSRLTVDGLEFRIRSGVSGVRFEYSLGAADDAKLVRFGAYAAGRLAREDAVLAFDPSANEAFIWQGVPRIDDDGAIRRVFEEFAVSAEWWHDRLAPEAAPGAGGAERPELVIRP